MCVRWHPFSHVVSRWRLHTHLHCGLIASICPRIRPRMISNIVLHSHVGKTLSSKTNCWAKASNYKYIYYNKLRKIKPAHPPGCCNPAPHGPQKNMPHFQGKRNKVFKVFSPSAEKSGVWGKAEQTKNMWIKTNTNSRSFRYMINICYIFDMCPFLIDYSRFQIWCGLMNGMEGKTRNNRPVFPCKDPIGQNVGHNWPWQPRKNIDNPHMFWVMFLEDPGIWIHIPKYIISNL